MFEDSSIFNQLLIERVNYFIYVILLLIGLWAMIAKNNLIKKLIGMSIFQTAIILFYVSIGVKEGATIPIYLPEHDPHGAHIGLDLNGSTSSQIGPKALEPSVVSSYTNPLPHVLMLTAIVVGVATLGLALSVCLRIYRAYGTVEEDELLEKLEVEDKKFFDFKGRKSPRRRNSTLGASSREVTKAPKSGSRKTATKYKKRVDSSKSKERSPRKPMRPLDSSSQDGGNNNKEERES